MIVNFHHADASNAGDMLSSPLEYFDFEEPVTRTGLKNLRAQGSGIIAENLILGGGGLLGQTHFLSEIMEVFARCQGVKVIWGAGINVHVYPYNFSVWLDGWRGTKLALRSTLTRLGLAEISPRRAALQPDYGPTKDILDFADLAGVRDFGQSWDWVPCASCLHPLIDHYRMTAPTAHVGVIEHPEFMAIETRRWPRLTNTKNPIGKVLEFIAAHRVLVTSSYHAAYWAFMLGRAPVIIPWSSKFLGFKWPAPISYDAMDLRSAIKAARPFPEALIEAREANLRMAERVSDLFKTRITPRYQPKLSTSLG